MQVFHAFSFTSHQEGYKILFIVSKNFYHCILTMFSHVSSSLTLGLGLTLGLLMLCVVIQSPFHVFLYGIT